jgi:hypothetical protein
MSEGSFKSLVRAAACCALLSAACSESAEQPEPDESDGGLTLGVPLGPCNAVVRRHPSEGASHVPNCSELSYATNPPSSGTHYQNWATFQRFDFVVPRGFLVHSLEHGAVVVSYNCPGGCDDEIEQAEALIAELPADPICTPLGLSRRVVLVPDPFLDVRWAASAWLYTLRAECFGADAFRRFYLERFGRGPENLCNPGLDFGGVPPCP